MKSILWKVISLTLAVAMSAGVMTIFDGCNPAKNGSYMHCHTVQIIICVVGIAAAVSFLISIITGNIMGKKVFAALFTIVGAALAALAAFLPGTLISMCTKTTMRCWLLMRPFTIVMSVLILISVIVTIVFAVKTRFEKPKTASAEEEPDSYEL